MNRITLVAGALAALLYCACNKSSAPAASANGALVGKWTLTETLVDPGNGNTRWLPADRPGYYFIQFNQDNSAESNTYNNPGHLKRYHVVNDSTMHLIYANGTSVAHAFNIEEPTLTIMGGCREACGSRFTRAPVPR